jgi:hypothetical protein
VAPHDWLAEGGTFYVIGLAWAVSAAFFAYVGYLLGRAYGGDSDGCLLLISNVILTLCGGGIGLVLMLRQYPVFVFTSIAGAVIFPAIGTWIFLRKSRRAG